MYKTKLILETFAVNALIKFNTYRLFTFGRKPLEQVLIMFYKHSFDGFVSIYK